jgi:hypothetical protein
MTDAEHGLPARLTQRAGTAPCGFRGQFVPPEARDAIGASVDSVAAHCRRRRISLLPHRAETHRLPKPVPAGVERHSAILMTIASSRPPFAG